MQHSEAVTEQSRGTLIRLPAFVSDTAARGAQEYVDWMGSWMPACSSGAARRLDSCAPPPLLLYCCHPSWLYCWLHLTAVCFSLSWLHQRCHP